MSVSPASRLPHQRALRALPPSLTFNLSIAPASHTNMQDGAANRAERFESTNALPRNKFLAMKGAREDAIRESEVQDLKPRALKEAVTLKGTCMDMCPEFEREEREYQNNVDPLEMILPQPEGTSQRRIDHAKAVKAFARSAAGNQVQASDIRPPQVLKVKQKRPTHHCCCFQESTLTSCCETLSARSELWSICSTTFLPKTQNSTTVTPSSEIAPAPSGKT